MKVLKRIKQLASSHTRGSTVPTNNLPPIVFHGVHGENVQLSRTGTIARRTESFCKGITFSDRPVCINERIYLKFVETSNSWSGALRLGFTNNDPVNFRSGLPKYACPDLTNKPGNWAKALGERFAEVETTVYYYVTENGDVYYNVNGEDKGVFFSGVNTSGPLWALIDIYGNTVGVEFIDPRPHLNNNRQHVVASVTALPPEDDSYLPSVAALNLENEDAELQAQHSTNSHFIPLPFHKTHGVNITLSADRCIATRSELSYSCGYVFTSRPLQVGERLVVKVLHTETSEGISYEGSLTFGVTSCNPAILNARELPEESDDLVDRMEYWALQKNVANCPQIGDELSFMIAETGALYYAKNNQTMRPIMHVDETQQLWVFFDIYGNTLKLQSLGIGTELPSISRVYGSPGSDTARVANSDRTVSNTSSSFSDLRVNLPPMPTRSGHSNRDDDDAIGSRECVVCYDQHANSVLYSCGHVCMCYTCALQHWKGEGGGQCPMCRAVIRDVIRIFRS